MPHGRHELARHQPTPSGRAVKSAASSITRAARSIVSSSKARPITCRPNGSPAPSSPAGTEIATRPFQLVTGRVWRGTAFGGARGRTDVPKIVDWYMQGKIDIDPMITHTLALDDINKGFDLMHAGESIRSVVVY